MGGFRFRDKDTKEELMDADLAAEAALADDLDQIPANPDFEDARHVMTMAYPSHSADDYDTDE